MRQIVKARLIGGVICMTIPKEISRHTEIRPGDKLMVEVKKDGTLVVKKEDAADA